MKLFVFLMLLSLNANAFDILLTPGNPTIEIEELVEAGATSVRCEGNFSTSFPRCIFIMKENNETKVGIQYEGQEISEVGFKVYPTPGDAFRVLKSLKNNDVCN